MPLVPSFVIESIDADGQLKNNTFAITTADFCFIGFIDNTITHWTPNWTRFLICLRTGISQIEIIGPAGHHHFFNFMKLTPDSIRPYCIFRHNKLLILAESYFSTIIGEAWCRCPSRLNQKE
jgi:hypothetical protein